MKQVVLLLLMALLPLYHPAQAQNPLVMSLFNAAQARSQASNPYGSVRKQDAQAYTKVVSYEGEQFLCKRCPEAAQLQPGGAQVVQLEQFLERRYAALLTDTLLVLSPALEAEYATLSKQVWLNAPVWNTQAYDDEMAFYRQEDEVRQQWRQQVQAARQRRALRQAHRDSITRQALPQRVAAPRSPPARMPRE
ncbi:MAG: hypothetical protein ACRYG7_10225 [Janthinobacterium lividum]